MSSPSAQGLIPPSFLFRIESRLQYTPAQWTGESLSLPLTHVVPSFDAELNGGPYFGEVRMGWNESGLLLQLTVAGKSRPLWCQENRCMESDGIQIVINTRRGHDIHRATRFCRRFALLPAGRGRGLAEPVAHEVRIDRAREEAEKAPEKTLQVRSEKTRGGYRLDAHIASEALTGFDPAEHPVIGFNYVINDRELGQQTFLHGTSIPYSLSDPSLWGDLQLVRAD